MASSSYLASGAGIMRILQLLLSFALCFLVGVFRDCQIEKESEDGTVHVWRRIRCGSVFEFHHRLGHRYDPAFGPLILCGFAAVIFSFTLVLFVIRVLVGKYGKALLGVEICWDLIASTAYFIGFIWCSAATGSQMVVTSNYYGQLVAGCVFGAVLAVLHLIMPAVNVLSFRKSSKTTPHATAHTTVKTVDP